MKPASEANIKKWYAIYTRAKAEKRVFESLSRNDFQAFLPMIKRMRQWSDRKKMVDEPLFRSYVFIFIEEKNLYNALDVFGALKFVSFERKAVAIPERQIEAIKHFLEDPEEDDENVEYTKGQMVRVKSGAMEGLIGTLITIKNKHRLEVMIDAIGQVIRLNIARSRVEPLEPETIKNEIQYWWQLSNIKKFW